MASYRVPVLDEFSWQPPVKDKELTAPPGGETKGDRYIVGGSATGAWSGLDNHIVTYDGAAWIDATPVEGWRCWIDDEDVFYYFDGTNWQIDIESDNAASIDSLETVASSAISSIDSLESEISTNKSLDLASIDSLELTESTCVSLNTTQDASIDSLETVASAAIGSIDSLESEISTNKSLDLASIDSLELIDSANTSTNVLQDASIDSLELIDSVNLSTEVADVASIDAAKQDLGTYVSEYGAIEFTI